MAKGKIYAYKKGAASNALNKSPEAKKGVYFTTFIMIEGKGPANAANESAA